ncbi:MAG: helix-turn-helix domain-containing protein [Clostridia bacterium]|nr:helix-turn-helix domain-containing protein [Clostridia bacterium]
MIFHKRLKELRQAAGLSQQGLADELGISKSSISMYERGEREPGFALIAAMADRFSVDTDYLLGRSSYKNKEEPVGQLPLLGEIACGEPIFAHEEKEQILPPIGIRADFCLRAKGDSMVGARITDGDLVFIRRQPMVENGEIAAVIIDDSATLKRLHYRPEEGILTLMAENPRYAPLVYAGEELSRVRILGKAVAFQSKLGE